MWLNLLTDDRHCDNITKLKEKKKEKKSHWLGTFLSQQFFQPFHKRENPATESRLTWKAASTGRTGHGTGTRERDRGRVGAAAGLVSYYPTCDYYLLALSSGLLSMNTSTSSIPKIGQGELLRTLVPCTFGSEAY
jgi:hypothetical protein